MGESSESGDEHVIRVEATWKMAADVTPEMAEYLTGDGEYSNIYGEGHDRAGVALDHEEETKRIYECRCGRRFRSGETAREHLEQAFDTDGGGESNG